MEPQATDVPEDPFAGEAGRCPHCGAAHPSAGADVAEFIASYIGSWNRGRPVLTSHVTFRSRCGGCGTDLCASAAGRPNWSACDPAMVVWFRDRGKLNTGGHALTPEAVERLRQLGRLRPPPNPTATGPERKGAAPLDAEPGAAPDPAA